MLKTKHLSTHNEEVNHFAQVVKNCLVLQNEIELRNQFNACNVESHKEGTIRAARLFGMHDLAKEFEADLKELKS